MRRKTLISGLCGLLAVVVAPVLAQASAITGIAAGANTTNVGIPPLNGTFVSSSPISAVYDTDAPDGSGIGDSTGSILMSVTALAKHRPFNVNFSMLDTTFIDGITSRTFSFAVTVTNGIGDGTAAAPDQPQAAFDDIQNIEFEIIDGPGPPLHTFVPPPTFGPASNHLYVNGAGNSVLRFGGINGGGPAITSGGSRTFDFTVVTTASASPWSLRITANPEPSSIVLGGLGMCLAGGIGYGRRRLRKEPRVEPDASPALTPIS